MAVPEDMINPEDVTLADPSETNVSTVVNLNVSSYKESTPDHTAETVRFALSVCIASVFSLVAYVVIYGIWKISQLRNREYIMSSSLIVADGIFGVYGMISIVVKFVIIVVQNKPCTILTGCILCLDNWYQQALNGHLIAISIDRFVAIVHPYFYGSRLTENTTKYFIIGAWIYGLLIALVHFHYMRFVDWSTCIIPYSIPLQSATDIFGYWLVVATMLLLYGKIFLIARAHRSKMIPNVIVAGKCQDNASAGSEFTSFSLGSQSSPNSDNSSAGAVCEIERKSGIEFKAARMTALILGSYTILWIPFQLGRIISAADDTKVYAQYLVQVGVVVGHLNAAFNWIIYGVYNQQFRKYILKLFSSRRDRM